MIELLLVSVLIAFVIFVVTWILTKLIGNSPESKTAVAKIFLGLGIVIFVIFILYVAISYIFNLNNGSQVNWVSLGGSSTRKFLDELCHKNHVTLNSMYELASYGLVLDFVKEGLGIGFVNKKDVFKELNDGLLFEIKTDFIIPSREIGVAVNKKVIDSNIIKSFLKCLKDYSNE